MLTVFKYSLMMWSIARFLCACWVFCWKRHRPGDQCCRLRYVEAAASAYLIVYSLQLLRLLSGRVIDGDGERDLPAGSRGRWSWWWRALSSCTYQRLGTQGHLHLKVKHISKLTTSQGHLHLKVNHISRSSTSQGHLHLKVKHISKLTTSQGHLHLKVKHISKLTTSQGHLHLKVNHISRSPTSQGHLHHHRNCGRSWQPLCPHRLHSVHQDHQKGTVVPLWT